MSFLRRGFEPTYLTGMMAAFRKRHNWWCDPLSSGTRNRLEDCLQAIHA
ncbi:hypothetical protein RISK_004261 [Rhodopirellula islandica]|uniref:Uncharacterized protein n=1 Tax=Rhodopirellula islandica TaxID=595434 RepID=A0A0J1EEC7_RHOIS|nr:hypothetical protein RISK_004261 [Rhodopirellula islandica]